MLVFLELQKHNFIVPVKNTMYLDHNILPIAFILFYFFIFVKTIFKGYVDNCCWSIITQTQDNFITQLKFEISAQLVIGYFRFNIYSHASLRK